MENYNEDVSGRVIQEAADSKDRAPSVEYAGFWIRFLASVLDSILLLMVVVPLLLMFYGPDVLFATESPGLAYDLINYALPIVAVIIFWQYRAATPGKMMMDICIVDADTLHQPAFGRLVLRYLGYYVSILTLFLGFFWIGWDKRKQGFHDKIANTVVIRKSSAVATRGDDVQKDEVQTQPAGQGAGVEPARPGAGTDPWKE